MGHLRVIPLGGAGEIGKNCTVVETDKDLIVVDCGISFPHEEQYGVDIVIPDFSYILENKDKLRGIFITHAHEDHIGALAYLLPHVDCPVFASPLTEAFIRMRLEEKIRMKDPRIVTMGNAKTYKAGDLEIEPVRVTHSIPETMALAVHTEHGAILFTADFKFDNNPVDRKGTDFHRLAELGEEGVLLLMSDSTNVDRSGWSTSEGAVTHGLETVMSKAEGRVIVTMFSSNIHRMQQICNVSKSLGRYVCVAGRRMEQTFQMCRRLGYLSVDDAQIVPIEDVPKFKPTELTIIATGSQGEPRAALSQMSRAEYSRLKVIEGDTIVYSARPIPGNEGPIWRTINRLTKLGARVIIDADPPIHASGHGSEEELKLMVRLTKPFYVAPVHGEPRHQQLFLDLLDEIGHPAHRRFVLANGDTLAIDDQKAWVSEPVAWGDVYLDQNGNHVVEEHILRERHALAHEGVIVVTVPVDQKTGSLEGKPKAVAHGLIGGPEHIEDIVDDLCTAIAKLKPAEVSTPESFKATLEDLTRKITWRTIQQKPVVIAIIQSV